MLIGEEPGRGIRASGLSRATTAVRHSDAFVLLFGLLLVSFVFYVAGGGERWTRIVGGVLSAATLVLAGRGAHASKAWVLCGWLSLLLIGLAVILGEAIGQRAFLAFTFLLHAVLFLFTMFLIVRRLARHAEITVSTVAGALCLYLLIGMVFPCVFLAVAFLTGRPFLEATGPGAILHTGDYFYFSFVTMTTTGFGDVVPATGIARALSMVEAVLGQLFLATLVARLVSAAGIKRRSSEET